MRSRTSPATDTAGATPPSARTRWIGRLRTAANSIAGKLIFLLIVFVSVPVLLYGQFRSADREERQLLLNAIHEQGRLVAQGLRPLLADFTGGNVAALNQALEEFSGDSLRIRLLLRTSGDVGSNRFFYIGVIPKVSADFLERDRQELITAGILSRLDNSCDIGESEVAPHRNPAGEEEVLTAIVPVETNKGCWVVILSYAADRFLGTSIGRPYWDSPEIRYAALIYFLMAVVILTLFVAGWQSLRRFSALARQLRTGPPDGASSFADSNNVPELRGIAAEFDALVAVLRRTADAIRLAAHENAHALKTPLAIISQSLEPLKRRLPADDERVAAAFGRIEQSVQRLDALVSAAQRMDQAIAESLQPDTSRIALSSLVERLVDTYTEPFEEAGVRLDRRITPDISVNASEDSVELLLENVIENARDFSPADGKILVSLTKSADDAEITVEDEGPGVDPADLDKIFERYHSVRPAEQTAADGNGPAHFGIGLWIVRRNVEALGGSVVAENRDTGGLRVRIRLPMAA